MVHQNKLFLFLILPALLSASPLGAGTLVFSKPIPIAILPWVGENTSGVPLQGPDGLLVDGKKRLILQTGKTLDFFSPRGQCLQSFQPIGPDVNFYGFTSMEILPDGSIALLARLESPLEQKNKDNFEERAKPGARLILVDQVGKVTLDKEELDPRQPHSLYYLQDGQVQSIHEDGGVQTLDRLPGTPTREDWFEATAPWAFNPGRWQAHLEKLPVYRSKSSLYHDVKNQVHENKGALGFLLGRRYIESSGLVGEKDGRIYYQVVMDRDSQFSNAVFVEDLHGKNYGLVELVSPDEDLSLSHDHALFVDKKGNLFEGVAQKKGYEIYEWKSSR